MCTDSIPIIHTCVQTLYLSYLHVYRLYTYHTYMCIDSIPIIHTCVLYTYHRYMCIDSIPNIHTCVQTIPIIHTCVLYTYHAYNCTDSIPIIHTCVQTTPDYWYHACMFVLMYALQTPYLVYIIHTYVTEIPHMTAIHTYMHRLHTWLSCTHVHTTYLFMMPVFVCFCRIL